MYPKFKEDKIKHSLMILIYTFLVHRLGICSSLAVEFVNELSDILHPEYNNVYNKTYLSTINYLPIFLHKNNKDWEI